MGVVDEICLLILNDVWESIKGNTNAMVFFLSCRYTNPIHCLTHSFATSL